ncbi:MAG TPA: hypothetical protein VJZ00_10815, partial [Thermoanaerobaculia bacterium]|nr:hypothetical protein [Thermoanaerobaculia bacterium]
MQGRLSTASQWQRSQPPSASTGRCEKTIATHADALQLLTTEPACIDVVIEALERRFSRTSAEATSDLSVAYFAHGDFLGAFEAAERAVRMKPQLPAALFNRALAEEALGLFDEALVSWSALSIGSDGWAQEARTHRDHLRRLLANDAMRQWNAAREKLPAILRARDEQTLVSIIARHPAATQRYFEEELLPLHWDDAVFMGTVWSRVTRDPFCADVVRAHDPHELDELRNGFLAFSAARAAQEAADFAKANAQYAIASHTLAGNPLRLLADVGKALGDPEIPASLEREIASAPYPNVRARMEATRVYLLQRRGRLIEALPVFDRAIAAYASLHDLENVAAMRGSRGTVLSEVGDNERAWHEALEAVRAATEVSQLRLRHRVLGGAAKAALALDHPVAALAYQNAARELFRTELFHTPPERLDRIRQLQVNLAVVYRARATINLALDDVNAARADLDEARRLAQRESDATSTRLLQARVAEVRGRALLREDPLRAAQAFSEALQLSTQDEFLTFRASLFAQRAGAWRQAKRLREFEEDLKSALAELDAEERLTLTNRTLGQAEREWSPYFSRFQET